MIINGEELITNPAKIILEAQDFMNLDPIIKEENFVFDKEKGTAFKISIFRPVENGASLTWDPLLYFRSG